MRIFRTAGLLLGSGLVAVALAAAPAAHAQSSSGETAADAVNAMAGLLNGANAGVSGSDMLAALEGAAAAGQPLALWRLGMMYESGVGVPQDRVKAFSYFSQIADQNADAPPRSVEADIVAQSFVKIGDYYRVGLPDAGIAADEERSKQFLFHAASYFGDADAQYRVALLLLDETSEDANPLQAARWLSLAAQKGHVGAQTVLGEMLFNGDGVEHHPVEGLMWLTLAHQGAIGTEQDAWVNEILTRAMSVATPEQRLQAVEAADAVRPRIMAGDF